MKQHIKKDIGDIVLAAQWFREVFVTNEKGGEHAYLNVAQCQTGTLGGCDRCNRHIEEHGYHLPSCSLVCPGDWIVRNGSDHYVVCDNDFKKDYFFYKQAEMVADNCLNEIPKHGGESAASLIEDLKGMKLDPNRFRKDKEEAAKYGILVTEIDEGEERSSLYTKTDVAQKVLDAVKTSKKEIELLEKKIRRLLVEKGEL